ncbi:MAG: hypothetical protein ABR990_04785 [Terracidiphilus sp.]|jgi:hypothetical protein
MRKSREVPLTLLAAIALSSIGCEEHRNCVDAQNRIVSDSNCSTGYSGAHYVYGGASGGHVGDAVVGGSVSRGGFGAIGGSGGSGGGE